MTIDEAISKYKEITNTDAVCPGHCNIPCEKCLQESEQLAEWLEELKTIKDGCIPIIHGKAELELHDMAIRTKAIDDFADKLKQDVMTITFGLRICDIDRIAEQLMEQK